MGLGLFTKRYGKKEEQLPEEKEELLELEETNGINLRYIGDKIQNVRKLTVSQGRAIFIGDVLNVKQLQFQTKGAPIGSSNEEIFETDVDDDDDETRWFEPGNY